MGMRGRRPWHRDGVYASVVARAEVKATLFLFPSLFFLEGKAVVHGSD